MLFVRKCYELVTGSEIRAAQYSIASEIEPQIKELIALAEGGLDTLRAKEKALAAKVSTIPACTLGTDASCCLTGIATLC